MRHQLGFHAVWVVNGVSVMITNEWYNNDMSDDLQLIDCSDAHKYVFKRLGSVRPRNTYCEDFVCNVSHHSFV